jgi:hypothetical protein
MIFRPTDPPDGCALVLNFQGNSPEKNTETQQI